MSNVIIGSARCDERGKYSGGIAGDQKQSTKPDYKGEVSMQSFYLHKKGWTILRAKDPVHAERIASSMETACNNSNIGYDQNQRTAILSVGTNTKTRTECDCSTLIRQCVKEATGVDPGNFTTANEKTVLMRTGLFSAMPYTLGTTLYTGDVLVTQTKGHTVAVTSGASRGSGRPLTDIAREVIAGKWGNGNERKSRLKAYGYDPDEVQRMVNKLLK